MVVYYTNVMQDFGITNRISVKEDIGFMGFRAALKGVIGVVLGHLSFRIRD